MKRLSIKTKITATVSVLFLTIFLVGACLFEMEFEKHFKKIIMDQQFELVSEIARDIDEKLTNAHNNLIFTARTIPVDNLGNHQYTQRKLEKILATRYFIKTFFDNGVNLYSKSGILIAEVPFNSDIYGNNFSYREYIKQTIKNKRPYISKPYISSKPPYDPVVMFTAPILSSKGEITAILGGSVSLVRDNVIGGIANVRIGKTGYLYLYGSDRTIIVHPDKTRILKQDVPVSINKLFDKAITGFEGTEETATSKGLFSLSSFRRLQAIDWILAANYPIKEAYEPIYKTKWYMAGYTLLCIALSVLIVLILMRKYLSPLSELAKQAEEIGRSDEFGNYIILETGGEIGALVTSFNEMLKKLFEREEINKRTKFIVNSITDLISLIDNNYTYQAVNDTWCNILQLKQEDIIGKTLSDVWGEKTFIEHIKQYVDRCFTGETVSYQLWLDFGLNGQKYCDVIFYPYFGKKNLVTHIVSVTRDITARKDIEDQLRNLSQAVEQSPVTVVITDVIGNIKYINPKFTQITGYTKEEVLEQNPRILKSGEIPPEGYKLLWDTIISGRVWRGEFHNKKKNGKLYWESASISPIKDQDGAITHFVAIKEDITAIKQAHEELAKLSLVASKTDNCVIITDKNGYVEWINDGFTRITGYTLEEAAGKKPGELLQGPLTDPETVKAISESLKKKQSISVEILNYHKNGNAYWISMNITPIFDEKGDLTHFIAIESDITERKRGEAELREAKIAAEAASQAKSDFLASMSHEIRTPMNAIIGMAELLTETPLNSDQLKYVDIFKNAGENLLNIINDILDLSKIEAGHIDIESVDFSLEDLIEKTCDVMSMRAHSKGIEFACRILSDVPNNLIGDPLRLRQILVNLIGNAIKFTEEGEVFVEVSKQGSENSIQGVSGSESEMVIILFTVRDTGIGIPKNKLDKVFEKFTQADSSTTRKYGGTGLGLSISKCLVEIMGGSILVDSEADKGSIFSFTACFGIQRLIKEKIDRYDTDIKGLSVLVVDDNATNRMILNEMLSGWGCIVAEAGNGEDGIALLKTAKKSGKAYNLILLDYHMPLLDGFGVAERIKNDPAINDITIIMLSSDVERGLMKKFRDIGVASYLSKPIKRAELKNAILTVIGKTDIVKNEHITTLALAEDKQMPLHILLVDDSEDNRLLIITYLKKYPYNIDIAENGEMAIKQFKDEKYDLVLMDMQMPVMDGYIATRKIREWENKEGLESTPIIALTAYALKEETQKSIDAGCDAHITKPIKKATLLEAIRVHVKTYDKK
jgi:two-component system, sensor histidine kinase and response regulator